MGKRTLAIGFWWICALEAFGPLIFLWNTRTTTASGGIAGLSAQRFGLMLIPGALALLFAGLAERERRAKSERGSPLLVLLSHRFRALILFFLFLAGLTVFYIFILSPMRVDRLHGYFLRWMPLFLWGMLVIAQFFLLALLLRGPLYWRDSLLDLSRHPRAQRIGAWLNSPAAGMILLAISALIGLTKIYYGRFVDEADTMTVGWLITKGYVLYRDVFSHHFPFAYYWAAGVVSLFGNSFVAIRVSVLLLQIALFAAALRMTGNYLVIGLISLVWNLVNQFHRGHEAIYQNLEGLFLLIAGVLILSIFVKSIAADKPRLVFIGLLLSLAVLSDPLMVYPAGVAYLGLFVSGLLEKSPLDIREGLRRIAWAAIPGLLVAAVFLLVLIASGTLQEFYRATIWFNAEIYTKYVDAEPVRLGTILREISTGFHIFSPVWMRHLSPFIPLETARSVGLADEDLYNSWIFSSFLFRLSILACVTGLILNRKAAAGIFWYLFTAALLIRSNDSFYTIGFTLAGIFSAIYLVLGLSHPAVIEERARRMEPGNRFWQIARLSWAALVVAVAVMQLWSAFRGGYFLVENRETIFDDRHVSMYQKFGDDIRNLACHQKNLEFSIFPINPIVYFVTELPPASKYTFMYPWIAEFGQRELIDELRDNPSAVVVINTGRQAGEPDSVAIYMADTIDFLNREYVLVQPDIWLSAELYKHCNASQ